MNRKASEANILIVDDDEALRNLLVIAAKSRGWNPVTAETGGEGLRILNPEIKAVVLDHGLPDVDGITGLGHLRKKHSDIPVVMLTGLNDAETAVRALRAGADDYITKPFDLERLFDVIHEACRARKQGDGCRSTAPSKPPAASEFSLEGSKSPRMMELYRQLRRAAQLDITVLLTGESGTGKTLIAREIHRLSARNQGAFIPVSCPALPRELLESELFGHERGAFTGATAARAGRFEQSSGGTLFLDEIGDLPGELQPKLLTVLQDREYFRVGGSHILRTDARVIAATNVDLRSRVAAGLFREDLYYRLNIVEIHLPPLRERIEDLPALASSVLNRIAARRGVASWSLTADALDALANHDWPGNIRQLENVLERASAFADSPVLDRDDIVSLIHDRGDSKPPASGRILPLHEVEKQAFIEAFERNGRNKARTARDLGIAVRTVYNILERYGLK